MTIDEAIDAFSNAIALAEGFYVSGSRPARNNNPGDLTVDTIGKGVGKDGPFIIYATVADGWAALQQQVRLMLTDASSIYNSDMTIAEVAARYTTTEVASWAANVAAALGVSVDTKLSDLFSVAGEAAGIGAAVVLLFGLLWMFRSKPKK